MAKWQAELAESKGKLAGTDIKNRPKPWKKKCEFMKEDVVGKLHMVLSNGVYVDTLNLMPRIQNQIRSLAAFDNPEFYKNKRLGYSNYYNFSAVYLGKFLRNVRKQEFRLRYLIKGKQVDRLESHLTETCDCSKNSRQNSC